MNPAVSQCMVRKWQERTFDMRQHTPGRTRPDRLSKLTPVTFVPRGVEPPNPINTFEPSKEFLKPF